LSSWYTACTQQAHGSEFANFIDEPSSYLNIVYEYQYQLCKKNSILILNNETASGITLDMGTQRFLYYGCKLFTTHKSHRNPNFFFHFGETE